MGDPLRRHPASNEASEFRHWLWRVIPASNDRLLLCMGLLGAVAVTLVMINGSGAVFARHAAQTVTYVRQAWRVENAAAPGVPLARAATIRVGDVIQVTVDLFDYATGAKAGEASAKIAFNAPDIHEGGAAEQEEVLEFLDAPTIESGRTNSLNRRAPVHGGVLRPGHRFRALRPGEIAMVAGPGGGMLPKGDAKDAFYRLTVVP